MKSPARNGKSVLRAVRVPHELDEQIRRLCEQHSLSYSGCVVKLARQGLKHSVSGSTGHYQSLDNLITDLLAGSGGKR
ncbi:hypothetical protein KU74_06145 [Pectobacterium brasiliense]|uniref:Uncharacterized protein n=1 Tax=Pectobacterium brasiliense TaxID=180957 RepID=A0A0M2F789_9GAMM|nr:hypothetical protein [Pectobacterium brasiliense]KGA36051.1 hypothetical protein KU74_06145 [Pectobacterium brasiliense]